LKQRGVKCFSLSVLGKLENAKPVIKLVEDLGIDDIVRFEGFADPFPFLAKCDLMVYPTLYDAFPDAVLESLHAGCPVIATSVGGIPDLLKYPELMLELADSAGLADRIEKCIEDDFFYGRLRKLCAERALEFHFDWAEKFNQVMINYNQ
jgi:glycosyltransferase involved in cell wall biosynthesis